MYGAPHAVGAPPAHNPARVYNPPPRTFDTPAAVNPTRSFSASSARRLQSAAAYVRGPRAVQPTHVRPARSAAPAAPGAPARSRRAPAPARSFGAPAGGGGFGRPGGGAPSAVVAGSRRAGDGGISADGGKTWLTLWTNAQENALVIR